MFGSETWCPREDGIAITRRIEKAMSRALCGVKLIENRNWQEQMDMLGL